MAYITDNGDGTYTITSPKKSFKSTFEGTLSAIKEKKDELKAKDTDKIKLDDEEIVAEFALLLERIETIWEVLGKLVD